MGGEDQELCTVWQGRSAVVLSRHDVILGPIIDQGTAIIFVGVQQMGIGKRTGTENAVGLDFGRGINVDASELIK